MCVCVCLCYYFLSYLNVFEYFDLKIEKDFFESHPNLGQLYNKVIAGSVIPPPQDDLTVIKVSRELHSSHNIII